MKLRSLCASEEAQWRGSSLQQSYQAIKLFGNFEDTRMCFRRFAGITDPCLRSKNCPFLFGDSIRLSCVDQTINQSSLMLDGGLDEQANTLGT